MMLHTHEVTGSSPVVSTNKKAPPWAVLFYWWSRDSNPSNADVRWTSATASAHTGCLHSVIESRSLVPHLYAPPFGRCSFIGRARDSNPSNADVQWTSATASAHTGCLHSVIESRSLVPHPLHCCNQCPACRKRYVIPRMRSSRGNPFPRKTPIFS